MKTPLLLVTASALLAPLLPAANLVGQWTFENASDLTEATVGSALTLNGTTSATTGVGGDGAIDVATGTASWISVPNPIGPNGTLGTPTRTNQYTIVLDFMIPDFKDGGADNGQFTGIFDFSNGGSDADYFIRKQANATELGVSTQWPYVGAGSTVGGDGTAGTVLSGTWYRLVLAADVGVGRSVYLNGNLIGNYNAGTFDTNTRQSMGTDFRVLWDNTATENSRAIISNIALFDAKLTPAEVTILGSAGDSLALPSPQPLTWTGGISGEWSNNVLGAPKNWVLTSDGTTPSDFEDLDTVLFSDGATTTTVDISNGDVTPTAVSFDTATDDFTITGTNGIAGGTGMLVDGSANLRIENANTHTGATDHSGFGDLTLANENALQNSTLITYNGNGYLFDGITAATLGGLDGSGDLALANLSSAALALTLGNNGLPASHDGIISGAGAILKLGNSIQTLAGANTYAGGTTVTSGVLSVGDESGLGTGAVTLGGVVDFEIEAGVESTVANDFTLPGGSGILRMFGSFAPGHSAPTPGTTTRLTGKISGGSIDRTFRFGDTGITLEHDNTTLLDNATNDFVGLIQQWRSVLSFTSDSALGDTENDIEINCGNYNGGLLFGADSTLSSTRTIELIGNETISSGDFTGTVGGPVTGAGSLRKLGSGTLVLTNASNDYAGVTQVNEGILQVDNALATGGGTVTVGANGTLGGTGTVDRNVTVNGSVAPGASVGTLSITGTTTINGALSNEIDGASTDLLVVTGDLTLGAASVLNVTEITPASSFPYVIATYSGTLTGTFASTPGYIVDYGTGSNSAISVTGLAPTFEDWATLKGVSGFNGDEDGDGISNGIEFVIGGEPAPGPGSNSNHLLPTATPDSSGNLVVVFRRMPDSAYLNPTVEYNPFLTGTWNPYPIPGTVIGTEGDAELVQVSITSALAVGGKIFARLTVENPTE